MPRKQKKFVDYPVRTCRWINECSNGIFELIEFWPTGCHHLLGSAVLPCDAECIRRAYAEREAKRKGSGN